ncbi:MAG: ribosome assembly RNA-binding protein YhbY [Gammaproteobacteria bacterium]|nr:ribosome assembly RNA-binding protein YhbY [Gammaproteobacteria bacterium]
MNISAQQKRYLRSLAHALKPVVTVGESGLSDAVMRELNLSIDHHELIKVRIHAEDREERRKLTDELCSKSNSTLIQSIGHLAVIYRPSKKPVIKLP